MLYLFWLFPFCISVILYKIQTLLIWQQQGIPYTIQECLPAPRGSNFSQLQNLVQMTEKNILVIKNVLLLNTKILWKFYLISMKHCVRLGAYQCNRQCDNGINVRGIPFVRLLWKKMAVVHFGQSLIEQSQKFKSCYKFLYSLSQKSNEVSVKYLICPTFV